jgi:hypothetical protein
MKNEKPKSISEQVEEIKAEICDKYCKYPDYPIPSGNDEDWLCVDGGPCEHCPLNKL